MIEVNDSALAEHLSGMLSEAGIKVVHREKLPAVDRCLADMAEYMTGEPPVPGPPSPSTKPRHGKNSWTRILSGSSHRPRRKALLLPPYSVRGDKPTA